MGNDNLSEAATEKYPDPVFQAFTIKTTRGNSPNKANKIVTNILGEQPRPVGVPCH